MRSELLLTKWSWWNCSVLRWYVYTKSCIYFCVIRITSRHMYYCRSSSQRNLGCVADKCIAKKNKQIFHNARSKQIFCANYLVVGHFPITNLSLIHQLFRRCALLKFVLFLCILFFFLQNFKITIMDTFSFICIVNWSSAKAC